jgi:protein subunit release factor A
MKMNMIQEDLLKSEDLKIEYYRLREGKGGQHVGCDPGGVKITHIPTGIQALVSIDRSQHINRMIAMDMIISALTHPKFR